MLKIKRISSACLLLVLIFVQLFPYGVSAATFEISDSLLNGDDTSIETGATNKADNQASGSGNKTQGPRIDMSFSSGDIMQQGATVTATAIPSYFNSDTKELYFTWYLKRSGCELSENDETVSSDDSCNLDGDDKITVNDWKIAAARIIIGRSFDRSQADYNTSIEDSDAGYKASPSPTGDWEINSGADTNDEDATDCYVQEPKSGLIYEMRRVSSVLNSCPDDAAGNHYHRACVSDQIAKCDVLNPLYTQENIDAAIAAGQIPPTKTISNDFNACAVASESDDKMYCGVEDNDALKNFESSVKCEEDGQVSLCVRDDGYTKFPIGANSPSDTTNPLIGIIFGKDSTNNEIINSTDATVNNQICAFLAKPNEKTGLFTAPPNFLDNTQPALSTTDEKCSTIKEELINGKKDSNGNLIVAGNLNFEPTCSFEREANMCKHLFPEFPENNVNVDGEVVDMSDIITGDGNFGIKEKQFWGADPARTSTNGSQKDEEAAVGLGVDSFIWTYSPGDQVGVVVEGDSLFPTEHADSSYRRMWAFSNNTCSKLEDLDKSSNIISGDTSEGERAFYTEGSGIAKTGFLTAEFDLNDCLEENLMDPDENNTAKLTAQLDASPANPINDPDGEGDILEIAASATNTQNLSGLLYKWSIQKSLDGSTAPIDTTNWTDITQKAIDNQSLTTADISGLDKKNLSINLNFPESLIKAGISESKYTGVFYLRIKLNITGSAIDGSQNATGTVIVRVTQQQNKIMAYQVVANNTGMLTMDNTSDGVICDSATEKTVCYVTKNEIIGLAIPNNNANNVSNVSWSINGTPIACSSSISTQCSANKNLLFFPILGNVGESVDVIAKGLTASGEVMQVTRHFVIIEPQIQISSSNSKMAWPKLLGYYKDLDGNKYPDYSTQVLEANTGNEVILNAVFYPQNKAGQAGFDWTVDGQILPEFHNQKQFKLTIDKASGDSYSVGLEAFYMPGSDDQINNIRKALLKNWSVSMDDVIEQESSTNIQLNIVDNTESALSKDKTTFSASLITHLPQQFMFLLKITLTSMLLIFATGILFAFIPERLFEKEGEN